MNDNNKMTVIDGETLADLRLPPTRFCVQTLLPQGVTMLCLPNGIAERRPYESLALLSVVQR